MFTCISLVVILASCSECITFILMQLMVLQGIVMFIAHHPVQLDVRTNHPVLGLVSYSAYSYVHIVMFTFVSRMVPAASGSAARGVLGLAASW